MLTPTTYLYGRDLGFWAQIDYVLDDFSITSPEELRRRLSKEHQPSIEEIVCWSD